MEHGNISITKDDRNVSAPLGSLYGDRGSNLTANGHESGSEPASPPPEATRDEPAPKRINPLRIHLGKRPFVDNSPPQYHSTSKKKKTFINRPSETSNLPVPKLIPSRKLHNVSSQHDSEVEGERDKPVPRLVPKSQLLHFKKSKAERAAPMRDGSQSLGLQPMVKFKCRKCGTMSFRSLALLKEHQLVCRAAQGSQPAASPEQERSEPANGSGPSRVTRKVYLCSACGTYYENWNLFLHMREVHNRHICLFCLGMFSKAEKLSAHLSNKHRVKEFTYNTKEEFCMVYDGSLYLMCCVCEEICSEKDDFFNHDCEHVIPKPVPVLVSKNAVKPNSAKPTVNGPPAVKTPPELVSDKKVLPESKTGGAISQSHKLSVDTNENEQFSCNSNPEAPHRDPSSFSTTFDRSILKEALSKPAPSPDQSKSMQNGDESLEQSDESDSPVPDSRTRVSLPSAPPYMPIDKEREGGIKLKLSLNNAKSPVIINSTVDPTVGIQPQSKPPPRVRKPPRRYEKEKLPEPISQTTPRMPSIKMTICDKADNSFVKATIFENSEDVTVKGPLNNNLESTYKAPEFKPDNRIKSTIYDNKIEDENSLNRVPKLTVRVPKELLDKDSSSDYSSDSDVSDKLTVDENNVTTMEPDKPPEPTAPEVETDPQPAVIEPPAAAPIEDKINEAVPLQAEDIVQTTDKIIEPKTEPMEQDSTVETTVEEPPVVELPAIELTLDKPLDRYPLKQLLKVFLQCTVVNCIYCNHIRKIAVNCEQLCLHMAAEHRFRATVDSITAEELLPETIAAKVTASAPQLHDIFINLDSYDSEKKFEEVVNDNMFECFQCYFKTAVHKDLYLHNRKMHQKTILLCVMCKSNFYSYSELLCHLCPGAYDSEYEVKFRCCYCNVDGIPSSFRLMVHLRKSHHRCDVCLELCHSQARLSNHVWKHKLHHLCYRCGIAYRNKPDITNHLFWKHGTQSVLCKRCLQKKWPHVYHFCIPPAIFTCDECALQFTRAVYLKVHRRFHSNEFPHACTEEGCTEKFVSRKLLAKHLDDHRKKLLNESLSVEKLLAVGETKTDSTDKPIPIIDLVDDDKPAEAGSSEIKSETGTEQLSKKARKKKLKDKDALLLDVNLPELNLSESDSDESDSGATSTPKEDKPDVKEQRMDDKPVVETTSIKDVDTNAIQPIIEASETENLVPKSGDSSETVEVKPVSEEKTDFPERKENCVEGKADPVEQHIKPIDGNTAAADEKSDLVERNTNSVEAKVKLVEEPAEEKKDTVKQETVENKVEHLEQKTDSVEGKANLLGGEAEPAPAKVEHIENVPEDSTAGKSEPLENKSDTIEDKQDEKQVLDIWDNFKKYQEKIEEKPKEKTPPLVSIRKHVCDSDHDYCLIPTDFNGDDDPFSLDKKKNNKKGKRKPLDGFGLSSSSSSGSSSDSSCSCGSNCSCSSSSSSTSSSSDTDSSDNLNDKKKIKQLRKKQAKRRLSTGSNVDVMGAAETPVLIPEPVEPPVAETDLETDESDTDEEFYDDNPQKIANKLFAEKRNQLLASVAPSDGWGEASRPATPSGPHMDPHPQLHIDFADKIPSSKKKSKKKKKSKSSRKRDPIKINIPKDMITKSEMSTPLPPLAPNKITISLQSNTVLIPEAPVSSASTPLSHEVAATSADNTRSSKRRRVRNKFYGYSSDEDAPQASVVAALKPTLPPKLEWRKEDLPSPAPQRVRREPPPPLPEGVRLRAPVPGPAPPRALMSAESSSEESSEEGYGVPPPPAIPPPSYLMSGTSSLPYAFAPPPTRQAREGESVYCYCRCPYDEVSEMIACDAEGCPIEWFHFECVGIMVPPKGKWYCPECRKNQSLSGYR